VQALVQVIGTFDVIRRQQVGHYGLCVQFIGSGVQMLRAARL